MTQNVILNEYGKRKTPWERFKLHIYRYGQMYLLILPAIAFSFVFCYIPMYGAQIAFRDYKIKLGVWGSQWVGFKHFERFFASASFSTVVRNTLCINGLSLVFSFPLPIILAILLNETKSLHYKKVVQMITYMPHFISAVVVCGMVTMFLDPETGIINILLSKFGIPPKSYLTDAGSFWTIYILMGIWQSTGWNSIIYVAALTNVDAEIIEAAQIDGTNRFQKIWYIDLPFILPTIMVMFILAVGSIMNISFEKILLLQNPLNIVSSDVISTYVYRQGIEGAQYSYATAIGLFNSLVNIVLLLTVNRLSSKLNGSSLF